jgi:hypothetical protein
MGRHDQERGGRVYQYLYLVTNAAARPPLEAMELVVHHHAEVRMMDPGDVGDG